VDVKLIIAMKLPSFANAPIVEIGPGEYFVGHSGTVIKTLLGSCVAVCLYDAKAQVFGLNHFLLATNKLKRSNILDSRSGYYGVHAMELVINGMIKLGANRQRIVSKVFGGGNVIPRLVNRKGDFDTVGEQNIAFAYEFLKLERITIVNEDVGGDHGRVIYFDSTDFSVYQSLINRQQELQLEKNEILYYETTINQVKNLKPKIKIWAD
jgi:chemotaxis protein CheD